ncbi:hypothetical protein, partial [Fusobacterium necrophorum]|uniref:hypothetical protein n=1 Tax=Fusobacterium necrophorum TaxID=859 RepID=UPI000568DF3E
KGGCIDKYFMYLSYKRLYGKMRKREIKRLVNLQSIIVTYITQVLTVPFDVSIKKQEKLFGNMEKIYISVVVL